MMDNEQVVNWILDNKFVAIVRRVSPGNMVNVARALYEGGIRCLEVTFDQASPTCISDAMESIILVHSEFGGEMLVGAGTVLTSEQAQAAKDAGAYYALSPDTNVDIIRKVKNLGMVSIPGAMTPTEVLTAWNAGADIVKLFPAGHLGFDYYKSIRRPINHVPMMAVGGVNLTNAKEFLDLGFTSCGLGNSLISPQIVAEGKYDVITKRASAYVSLLE